MLGEGFTTIDLVVLVVYFLSMAAMGPIFASKSRTTEGYFLGDRSFPGWLIGFSMFAASISSITFVAYPGDAYKAAWYRMSPNYVLPFVVLFAAYFFLPFFRRTHITSAYEYLEHRFGPKTRVYAACAFMFGQAIRVALILFLVSLLVEAILGWNPYMCIFVGGIVTSVYTVMGGIRAVLWTDFIQALVLWVGGFIALFVVLAAIPGGAGEVVSKGMEQRKFSHFADVVVEAKEGEEIPADIQALFDDPVAHGYERVEFPDEDGDPGDLIVIRETAVPTHVYALARESVAVVGKAEATEKITRVREVRLEPIKSMPFKLKDLQDKTFLLILIMGLGNWLYEYSANQNVIQRYAASKSMKEARIAMLICTVFSVPTWALFMFLGTGLYLFFQYTPTETAMEIYTGANGAKAESILPYFVVHYLPRGLTGLVIAAVLSAAMSSISSSMNAISAVGVVDVYRRHIAKDRDDAHYTFVAKTIGVVVAVIMIVGAIILMAVQSTTLQDTATILTALTAGGLLGFYMLGFFTKVADDRSMMLGIVVMLSFTLYCAVASKVGLPQLVNNYYVGFLGHGIMFLVGYIAGKFIFPRRGGDLTNLTVWTAPDITKSQE
ncbi:MAG: sodium:solute symporter [Candidatus Hydrogenedentes bacterium]|nr:sodium:solute symporter [Candidatus Hydrogenedentota bacterium]